jgi:hypothetical protein
VISFWKRRPKRLAVRVLTYAEADRLIKDTAGAWTIAPEEDQNRCVGVVWLELLEKPVGGPE